MTARKNYDDDDDDDDDAYDDMMLMMIMMHMMMMMLMMMMTPRVAAHDHEHVRTLLAARPPVYTPTHRVFLGCFVLQPLIRPRFSARAARREARTWRSSTAATWYVWRLSACTHALAHSRPAFSFFSFFFFFFFFFFFCFFLSFYCCFLAPPTSVVIILL